MKSRIFLIIIAFALSGCNFGGSTRPDSGNEASRQVPQPRTHAPLLKDAPNREVASTSVRQSIVPSATDASPPVGASCPGVESAVNQEPKIQALAANAENALQGGHAAEFKDDKTGEQPPAVRPVHKLNDGIEIPYEANAYGPDRHPAQPSDFGTTFVVQDENRGLVL